MSVYRINLFNTFENIISRGAFSVPSSSHPVFEKHEEPSWKTVEDIKKGNIIFLCRGVRQIWGIAIASDDCRITDIDSYKEIMKYEDNGYRFVSIDIYREFQAPIDGTIFFKDILENNPFEENIFCSKLIYSQENESEFNEAINKLLSTH
ncbi:MAG: hypothetical protein L6Q54_01200 [Leptospiraceae bacterium]|nr:hypothetical protein [Leptospiraceae bacterium]MCK6379856.1 hypothetical protein [Leptospiraceae bacterium]